MLQNCGSSADFLFESSFHTKSNHFENVLSDLKNGASILNILSRVISSRLLKKLKTKDRKQKELEKREKGFSIYVNGANVDLKLGKADGHKTSRKAKTADGELFPSRPVYREKVLNIFLFHLETCSAKVMFLYLSYGRSFPCKLGYRAVGLSLWH